MKTLHVVPDDGQATTPACGDGEGSNDCANSMGPRSESIAFLEKVGGGRPRGDRKGGRQLGKGEAR